MVTDFKDIPERRSPSDFYDPNVGVDQRIQPKWKIPDTIIIKAAVVGSLLKRTINPNIPYSPDEIRKEAMECIEAGATSIHVHARADDGSLLPDKDEVIRKLHLIIDPIKKKYGNNVIIDGCTQLSSFEGEVELLKAGLVEISPVNLFWLEPKKRAQAKTQAMQENGIKPQVAIYSDGDLDRAKTWLIDTGILKKPYYWILLPNYFTGCTPIANEFAAVESLLWHVRQIRQIDPESIIMVCMVGRASSYLVTMAMTLGLHIRVGMEDTWVRWPHKDDLLESNARAMADMIALAKILGRRVATANEYRALIGLPTR